MTLRPSDYDSNGDIIPSSWKEENMTLNEAINTIKETCKTYKTCVECPMNFNCNEHPAEWKEAKGDA